jgi:ATP-binding cassette subfamily B protein
MTTSVSDRRRSRPDRGSRAGFAHLIPFLLEHSRVLIIVAILSVLGAAGTLAQPLIVGQVIGRVESGDPLGILVWVLVGLVVISSVISGVQHFLLQRTGTAVVYSSRRQLIARILHLPIREFDARRVGDIVSRVGTDTTLLYAVLTQGLADSVGNVLIFAGAIVAMALIDPLLLVLILAVVGASIATVTILSGRIRRATREQQETVGELAAGVERAVGSIRTVRASGADDREAAALTETAEEAYRVGVRIAAVSALVVPVAGIALQLSLLVVLGVGGYRVASGAITIASLVTFVMFLFFLIQPLGSFFGAITSVNQALGALSRIQEILDLEPESAHDAELARAATVARPDSGADAAGPPAAIEFRDVHFRYPAAVADTRRRTASEARAILTEAHADTSALDIPDEEDGEVLRGVSFRVAQGSRVALVGPSGAGKSTALTLIERFYDPTRGAVLVQGADLRTLDRADLRSRLGYVEQDAPTLAGSLADNLRLTAPEASDDECEAALRRVNLGALLDRSPLGLDAPVGEAGIMLSGGERQRLAIARTLLAAPPVLLLDESTSSLDGANEQRMREAIDEVASGRTLLAIAHRLSTVVDSDLIVVLDRGRVVGSGTHAELIDSTPLYRDLASRQLLV